MPIAPLKTFIIYARADEEYKKELLLHLRPLVNSRLLEVWHDGNILPGEDWKKAIKKELANSELVVMLVSVNALNSEFIQTEELRTALDQLEAGLTRIVPIVISPCAWRYDPIVRRLQALPLVEGEGIRPVSEWRNTHLAWASLVEQIGDMAQEVQDKRAEAERQQQEEQERLAREAEQARLAEQEKQRQAEAAALAERERLAREQEEAKRLQQQEKERLAKEAEQTRLDEQARIAEQKRQAEAAALAEQERLAREAEQARLAEQEKLRQAEAAALAEQERLAREQAEKEARAEEVRRQAERKRQEEERAALFKQAHDNAWKKAQTEDTVLAYREFLDTYPKSVYVSDAKRRIRELEPNRNRKMIAMLSGGVILLIFLSLYILTPAREDRAPGFYLKEDVLDGAAVTPDNVEYVIREGQPNNPNALQAIQGRCFRSPDGSREIPKGTLITEEHLGRCAGIYAAQNLREGTLIEKKILDIEPPRPGSQRAELYDFDTQLRDMGLCVKCGTSMQKGEKLTRANIERCGGVYLKKTVTPGTVITADLVEEVPRDCAKEKHDAVYGKTNVVGMKLSSDKSKTFPAGKQLNYNNDF
jgi:chemotaxis protein histidine kinase CheA